MSINTCQAYDKSIKETPVRVSKVIHSFVLTICIGYDWNKYEWCERSDVGTKT